MLFKILHGDESRISLDITPFHEGWAYVTHSGNFYIDMNIGTVESPNNQRIKLNAKDAETLGSHSAAEFLLSSDLEEALARAKESGEFDGADGVSVTHIWNGTTLMVTSASGTSSANLKGDQGEPGKDGLTPHIGNNGNWWIGDEDTGVNAEGQGQGGGVTSWNDLNDKPFEETTEGIKTLDEKFIPDTIARVVAIEAFLEDAKTDASNKAVVVLAEAQKNVEELSDRIDSLLETKIDASELGDIKQEIITELQQYIGSESSQSDWNQTDETKSDYIKNKPTNLATADYVDNALTQKSQVQIIIWEEDD